MTGLKVPYHMLFLAYSVVQNKPRHPGTQHPTGADRLPCLLSHKTDVRLAEK